ncbi:MAG: DUF1822 family protein [Cyanobacteria bacterium J06648_16]
MTPIDAPTFTVSLGLSAHAQADQFRRYHRLPVKAKQVYLNALAVHAVKVYLDSMGIATDLDGSYSQQPAQQTLMDVADLYLPSGDRLECRPVLPEATELSIPSEVQEDRAGYVAVQLSENLREATLLGFVTEASAAVAFDRLISIERLPALLTPTASPSRIPVQLGQWLQNLTTAGWEALESWAAPAPQLAWDFRGRASVNELEEASPQAQRYQQYRLAQGEDSLDVVLVVGLRPLNDAADEIEVWIRLQPVDEQTRLPASLQLRILDADGAVVMQAETRQAEFLQLRFVGISGETFSLHMRWQATDIVESFVL